MKKHDLNETETRTLTSIAASLGRKPSPVAEANPAAVERLQGLGLVATNTKPGVFLVTTAGADLVRECGLIRNRDEGLSVRTFSYHGPAFTFVCRLFDAAGTLRARAEFKRKEVALACVEGWIRAGSMPAGGAAVVEHRTSLRPSWAFAVPDSYATVATWGASEAIAAACEKF